MKIVSGVFFSFLSLVAFSQSTSNFINQTNLDSLIKTVREFSGEDNCIVGGNSVKIINRVSSSGNDLAADYLYEQLIKTGLQVDFDSYSSKGRNVIAKQIGSVYPDSMVMICAHYDAVANYCADDNASGIGIVLEAARVLSKYQFEKTIVYACWDEEEEGLLGAKSFASEANSNNDIYSAILNIDMAGFDSNNDGAFDIDLNNSIGSEHMKDLLIKINASNNLNISPTVVQPGTPDSDHSAFWTYSYPAVLLGESWSTGDQNKKYHSNEDRYALFNLPYYHEISKLAIGFMGASAVAINSVSVDELYQEELLASINPATNQLIVEVTEVSVLELFDSSGKELFSKVIPVGKSFVSLSGIVRGIYVIRTKSKKSHRISEKKLVK
jgi:Zn-dependent M28 family amino/carboxypeptidase